jgi:hypothetical protein
MEEEYDIVVIILLCVLAGMAPVALLSLMVVIYKLRKRELCFSGFLAVTQYSRYFHLLHVSAVTVVVGLIGEKPLFKLCQGAEPRSIQLTLLKWCSYDCTVSGPSLTNLVLQHCLLRGMKDNKLPALTKNTHVKTHM